jgi:hypothetical protein
LCDFSGIIDFEKVTIFEKGSFKIAKTDENKFVRRDEGERFGASFEFAANVTFERAIIGSSNITHIAEHFGNDSDELEGVMRKSNSARDGSREILTSESLGAFAAFSILDHIESSSSSSR